MSKRRRRIIVLIILVFAGAAAARLLHSGGKTDTQSAPVPVNVVKAQSTTVPVYIDALGTVVPYRTVTVQPMITGPMTKVLFREGQFVKQGQLIAEIDPSPYQAALDQAKAKLAQDEASLVNAQLQEQQYASLVANNYTSVQQAAQARATAAEDAALVKQDQASIESGEVNLGYTKILAPNSGRTGILHVDPGSIVNPNLTNGIVVINTIQPISVQFSLPQEDLPQIARAIIAGPVKLVATVGGGPQAAPVLDNGTMSVLDNVVNANTGTLTLKGDFPNAEQKLWPGAYVNVRILVRRISDATTVPPVAVQQGPAGSFVFLVQPPSAGQMDRMVTAQPVAISYEDESTVVITKGIVPGDEVVTEGNSRLKDGATVRIAPPAASVPASSMQMKTGDAGPIEKHVASE